MLNSTVRDECSFLLLSARNYRVPLRKNSCCAKTCSATVLFFTRTISGTTKLNRWNKAHQQVFRQFVAEAEIVQLDASGRILLPKRCIQAVNIMQDVVFVGMGDTIEIWPKLDESTGFMDDNAFSCAIESLMAESEDTTKENDQNKKEE